MKKLLKKVLRKIKRIFNKYIYVSVIMPVYNVKEYLGEALDSLLNQSLKDIEIICIDDESNDGSYELLKEYAKKDRRVKVYKQKHSNAGNARNIGIKKSRGKYLLFLDSDDFFDKDLCRDVYHFANYYDTDVLLFSAYQYDNETRETNEFLYYLDTNFIEPRKLYSSVDLKNRLFHITTPCPWTKAFKREFIKEKGLKFSSLTNSNDLTFVFSSLALANRIVGIDEKLVNYRMNQKNSTQSTKHKNPLNVFKAYKELKDNLENENVFDIFYPTYLNYMITGIMFNINSVKTDEARDEIINYLNNGGFEELGIEHIDENLIYAKKKYEEFKAIFK